MAAPSVSLGPEALFSLLQKPPPPGQPYSAVIPNSEDRNHARSGIYRHWRYTNAPLLETLDSRVQTLHDLFELSAKKTPNAKCLGKRKWNKITAIWGPYQWMSYKEVDERRKNFGAGIRALYEQAGISEQKFGVGLWCSNRPEWQITGNALMRSVMAIHTLTTL
jgi:long-chain acyl-CoA synthetase